jgi:hypothetical protein
MKGGDMAGKKRGVPQFTPIGDSSACQHVTIECVCEMRNMREIEDILDNLRQYGAAVVTNRQMIGERFDEAARILDKRAMRE